MSEPPTRGAEGPWRGRSASIAVIALAQVAALSLWFSATAVIPALEAERALDPGTASWFTGAVQLGFVAGTLASAALGLADRLDPRRLFMASAASGAAANALIVALDPASAAAIALRFLTGVAMAGVYPVGMRLAATWARGDMGLMIGLLVGALTLGSAAPHLFNALSGIDWRITLAAASASALFSAGLIRLAGLGPGYAPAPRFRPGEALKAWTTPALRLANLGYLGHMWELYAMWAWIGVFLAESFRLSFDDPAAAARAAALATFATIAAGAIGSVAAGVLADRLGRTTLAIAAMGVSGACALVAGHLFGAAPVLLVALCLVWGAAVVADSAQFSASVAELSEPHLVGTMLTVQTSLGFLLTLATIHLVPVLRDAAGWPLAFTVLALGPAAGILAMARLRRRPEARRLARGRR
ncbi:MAG TPA: MFS transporter [Thermohalobaculum sp.]|nr:MFS transporter [Thermohalobaculum sp.]